MNKLEETGESEEKNGRNMKKGNETGKKRKKKEERVKTRRKI